MSQNRNPSFRAINTDEIKAKTDAALDALIADLQQGRSESLRKYLAVMGNFHNYSFANQLLIAIQKPEATHLAGFRAWNKFNRHVKKGAHGIMILAPLVGRKKSDEKRGQTEEGETSRMAVYVFDVSQTEGEPLPEFAKVKRDPAAHTHRLKELVAKQGMHLVYDNTLRPALGMSTGGTIKLAEGLSPSEEFSTLTHELASELLHLGQRSETTRTIRETETEAVAYVVATAIGLRPDFKRPAANPYLNTITQGDCVKLLAQMPAATVDLVLTDPPYLVRYMSRDGRRVPNDDNATWLEPAFAELYRVLRTDSYAISFYSWNHADRFLAAYRAAGFTVIGHLVFAKRYASSTNFLRYQHEQAYLLAKGSPEKPTCPISDVIEWTYTGNKLHPTQKPLPALLQLVKAFSRPGDIVLDPFCGSGSSLLAAKLLGRKFIGFEIDNRYAAIAARRLKSSSDFIQLYTGDKESLKASLEFIHATAQTILKGIRHEGASEGEWLDKESPHQARGSQKLTAESGTRRATPVTLPEKIIE